MPTHPFSYPNSSELGFPFVFVNNFPKLSQGITSCTQMEHFLLVYQLQTENIAQSAQSLPNESPKFYHQFIYSDFA